MMAPIRILGIDPGLRRTGWGVIEQSGSALGFVAAGTVISNASEPLSDRLRVLHEGLRAVLDAHRPDEVAIEQTFVNKDAEATLKLGHARGVLMLASALAGLPIGEYAPNAIKKAVVGAGHADKRQVEVMVRTLLPRATFDTSDAADALAIAICHGHHRGVRALADRVAS